MSTMGSCVILLVFGCFIFRGIHGVTIVDKAECYQQNDGNMTCKYRCHCVLSGKCTQRSCINAQCLSGRWGGIQCQSRNVVLGMNATISATVIAKAGAGKANDGAAKSSLYDLNNQPQCAVSEANGWYPWWQVKLTSSHVISKIYIYYRTDDKNCGTGQRCASRNKGLQVWVGNNHLQANPGNQSAVLNTNQLCYEHDGVKKIDNVADINCAAPIVGNTIIVLLPNMTVNLVLCEVVAYECDDYLFGQYCQVKCGCLDTNEVCHKMTGHCKSGCKLGHSGPSCKKKCRDGMYGDNCSLKCNCKPVDKTCHVVTGACPSGCPVGSSGVNCKVCDDGKFGHNCQGVCHCQTGHDWCNKVTGVCADAVCSAGWSGKNCQTPCVSGFYGQNCQFTCNCINSGVCNRVTGGCPQGCAPGYRGVSCNIACVPGKYGSGCFGVCRCMDNTKCLKTTGSCGNAGGCTPGYQGKACQKVCTPGTFGSGCTGVCRCKDNNKCLPASGSCVNAGGCMDGYTGPSCQRPTGCTPGRFGVGCTGVCHCQDNNRCLPNNGSCAIAGGCFEGYMGPACQRQCSNGKFGPGCTKTCHCKKNTMCSPTDGSCDLAGGCMVGYRGPACQERIPQGTTSPPLKCNVDEFRNPQGKCTACNCLKTCSKTGVCEGGICAAGWLLIKGQCQTPCRPKMFGLRCEKNCHCKDNVNCDAVTGVCVNKASCHHRYGGLTCQNTCPDGKYGLDTKCNKTCGCEDNDHCNVFSGVCMGSSTQSQTGMDIAAIAGGVIGAVLVLSVVIAIITSCVYKHKSSASREITSNGHELNPPTDMHVSHIYY